MNELKALKRFKFNTLHRENNAYRSRSFSDAQPAQQPGTLDRWLPSRLQIVHRKYPHVDPPTVGITRQKT